MKKFVFKNARQCLGVFVHQSDIDLYGNIEYSNKDFTDTSDDELASLNSKYIGSSTLAAKAIRLEVSERALFKWQRENS